MEKEHSTGEPRARIVPGSAPHAADGTNSSVWKTGKAWAGTCRRCRLTLADGTDHLADFRFE
ncbi:PxKF domain-containing protein [Streptomyces sp. NPDC005576]|uniref:PxKF domain-containing protein n=1 Tax=Streptomyces sp. NPDC005576 TaxID=3364726 RepID=UPI0036849D61